MRSRSECDDRRGSVWLPVYVARMAAIETSLLGDPEKENEREEKEEEEDLEGSRLEAVTVEEAQLPISVEDLEPELPGSLSEEALRALLQTRGEELGPAGREALSALLHREEHGVVSYRLFVEALSNKRRTSFRCAVSQGLRSDLFEGGIAGSSVGVVGGSAGVGDRCLLSVARETLPRDSERRWFLHVYSGCPPPLLMPSISLAQVVVFVLYGLTLGTWLLPTYDADFMNGSLLYSPTRRHEAWRFISYALTHAGAEQLGLALLAQLSVGLPLEMAHGSLRIGAVYMAGVLAGSLAGSVADRRAPLVGSSGGVYALLSAHLANIAMNWSRMKGSFRVLRMAFLLLLMSAELGRAVWLRLSPRASPAQPSFVPHLAGVWVGLTLGLAVLRGYEQRLRDQCCWRVASLAYAASVLLAVACNVAMGDPGAADTPPPAAEVAAAGGQ